MATPMTAAQWRAAMTKWHVPVVYRDGWETHGRPNRPWGPVNGIIIHHTGSDTNTANYINGLFATQGMRYPELPGPLCHGSTGPDGKITMGATRRANHAGAGTQRTFDHVVAEDYDGYDVELKPGGSSGVDGNTHFYGNEVRFSGSHPMTAEAYEANVRWAAAICDFHGWTALSVIGHREWTSAKWDPGHTDMAKFRRDVRDLLAAGPDSIVDTGDHEPLPDLDRMDPANYFIGAVGAHVTWLGERLVAHGFGAHYIDGPGPTFTEADRLNVRDFQLAQGWTGTEKGGDADGFPGPETLKRLAADPVNTPTAPKPKTLEIPVMLMPLAGYNATTAPGVTKWKSNTDAAIALVKKHKPQILGVTELSNKSKNPMRPRFDDGVRSATEKGIVRVNGSDGRYGYRDRGEWAVVASGVFEAPKAALFNGDDKQCAWAVLRSLTGVLVAVGCGHAENQNGIDRTTGKDADDLRVAQALSWKAQLEAKAVTHGASHVLLMGDFNSRGAVRDAIAPKDSPWKASTPGFVVGWDRDRHEAADWMFVSDGEIHTSVYNNPGSDHTVLVGTWVITV